MSLLGRLEHLFEKLVGHWPRASTENVLHSLKKKNPFTSHERYKIYCSIMLTLQSQAFFPRTINLVIRTSVGLSQQDSLCNFTKPLPLLLKSLFV